MLRVFLLAVLAFALSLAAQAGVTIKLKSGRTIDVPVECSEIESISFSGGSMGGGKPSYIPDYGKPPPGGGKSTSDAGQYGSGGYGMNILSAQYGIAGRYCDARPQVSAQCQGKEICQMYVANHVLCGDPIPGREKEVIVDVQCKGKTERRTVPEGAQLLLRCQ
jgi:hypothetical protein